MDLQELRSDLTERFPQWAERIWMLRFQDTAKVPLADNDGSIIYYNDRVMRAQSRENRCFYMAQQLLHLQSLTWISQKQLKWKALMSLRTLKPTRLSQRKSKKGEEIL